MIDDSNNKLDSRQAAPVSGWTDPAIREWLMRAR